MTSSNEKPPSAPDQLALRVEELHSTLREVAPDLLAARTGALYTEGESGTGEFHLSYWGREIALRYPQFSSFDRQSQDALGIMDRAMLAYYFHTSDGTPLDGRWISFSELPDGAFYTQAFQGYSGNELAKVFINDAEGFARAATNIGGVEAAIEESPGDMAFVFRVFPHVKLLVACWLGDEDFPPSYRVLFDAAAGRHLTTDAYAILGSMLTRRLVKAYREMAQAEL
jgi:hypothetical protein